MKKISAKRIVAIIGIVLLVAMYLGALISALCGATFSSTLFSACIIATVAVPIFTYVIILLIGRDKGTKVPGDPEE